MSSIQLHYTKDLIHHLQAPVVAIACSGGLDSMVLLHFFLNKRPLARIHLLHFNHEGGEHDVRAAALLREMWYGNHAQLRGLHGVHWSTIPVNAKPAGVSLEEHWRNHRMAWFKSKSSELGCPILTGHNLNDVAETWVHSSMTGTPKLIPYNYDDVVLRPFLTTERTALEDYAVENNLIWYEDESNQDRRFSRNRVRHDVLPDLLKHYPYMLNMLRRKIINRDNGNTPAL